MTRSKMLVALYWKCRFPVGLLAAMLVNIAVKREAPKAGELHFFALFFSWVTMNTITVRQAVLSDLEALAPLFDGYRQFYGRTSDLSAAREFLLERFNHGESVLFIAHEGNKPIGFTQLYPSFSSVSLARIFVLNDLFVCEHARRKGVASKLMSAAVDYASSLGAVRVSLSTATTNEAAQTLYQSAGWNRDEQFFVYHFTIPPTLGS